MDVVKHNNEEYPAFQATGNAARFVLPFAKEMCQGKGLDVGAGRLQWSLPGSRPVDPCFPGGWHADNLPPGEYDYIFSSHCLGHVPNWSATLDYWFTRIVPGGTLFLYLPDFSQKHLPDFSRKYWRPWSNTKPLHVLTPEIVRGYLEDRGCARIFVSGVDLNNSFTAVCEA